jgi:hypothetical protein
MVDLDQIPSNKSGKEDIQDSTTEMIRMFIKRAQASGT